MEESSVKRKERLAAMRMEASEGAGNSSMVSQTLANPLIEQPFLPPEPHAAPRFDYYTDPMAAFLPNKRGIKVSHQISPDFTNHPSPAHPGVISPTVQTTPNPGHFQSQGPYNNPGQLNCPTQQLNYTPELRPFQAQGPCYNPGPPFRSPAQQPNYPPVSSPFQAQGPYYDPRPFRSPAQQQPNYPPGSMAFQPQGPYYNPGPFVSPGPMGTPDAYNMPPGSSSHWGRPRGPSPNFVPNASPSFEQTGRPSFNHGQGRGYNNSGRGMSSGPGGSFKQSGSHNAVSAGGFNPRKYYKKSMVEDPWEGLRPVLWKHSKFSWLPKSLSAKKPRVSEAPVKKESGQSLAEYLAASFHEATHETDDNDNDDRVNV